MNRIRTWLSLLLAPLHLAVPTHAAAQTEQPAEAPADVTAMRQQAVRDAAGHVADAVVRIDATGGARRSGGVLRGEGPTTGLVVAADGLVVTSLFGLGDDPAGILVTLPDGSRHAARVLGRDFGSKVCLLKIDRDDLTPPPAAPPEDVRVGQWAVALGRTWSLEQPSVSVGIVSALGRVWGRALQTDAKVSPVNYGGPLVDLRGRVLGVLVPLSPRATDDNAAAGVEWYDSGIGFAVPLDRVLASLPRLREGDLHPGGLGVVFDSPDDGAERLVVKQVAAESKSGLQAGDVLLQADGQDLVRADQLKHVLGPKHVGDTVALRYRRGDDEKTVEAELVPIPKPAPEPTESLPKDE